jgi:4-hydroxybenzoate polyprenyltransferase
MRLDKPIGIFLLLWPTLWALWLAGDGHPSMQIVFLFTVGVVITRSLGCTLNDIIDRKKDGFVRRTQHRPLVTGHMLLKNAWMLACILLLLAFCIVLHFNRLTFFLAIIGTLLMLIYPFLKRVTHLPQAGLGLAFAWGVPMAFAAELNVIPFEGWILFLAAAMWPLIYDTFYAMVDREDDIKIGILSTAILFGKNDRVVTALLQIIWLVLLGWVGYLFDLNRYYGVSIFIAAGFCIYQQILIKNRDPAHCFKAFLNNHWVGFIIFLGIILGGIK